MKLLDFSDVIREEVKEAGPPPALALMAAVAALQRAEPRLNLDLCVHER